MSQEKAPGLTVAKYRRLRWVAAGFVAGVIVSVVAVFVVGSIVTSDPSDADVEDAARLAERWAAEHQRAGERSGSHDCEADSGFPAYRFA
jgi:hypothetical protein